MKIDKKTKNAQGQPQLHLRGPLPAPPIPPHRPHPPPPMRRAGKNSDGDGSRRAASPMIPTPLPATTRGEATRHALRLTARARRGGQARQGDTRRAVEATRRAVEAAGRRAGSPTRGTRPHNTNTRSSRKRRQDTRTPHTTLSSTLRGGQSCRHAARHTTRHAARSHVDAAGSRGKAAGSRRTADSPTHPAGNRPTTDTPQRGACPHHALLHAPPPRYSLRPPPTRPVPGQS